MAKESSLVTPPKAHVKREEKSESDTGSDLSPTKIDLSDQEGATGSFTAYKANQDCTTFVSGCNVNDTPLFSVTARILKFSDMSFIELREFDNDAEPEPWYQVFGHNPKLILKPSPMDHLGEMKKNCSCDECEFYDVCDEYRFGPYCVAAVRRYFEENRFFVTLKDAYIVYASHYNRALDLDSFKRDNAERKGLRSTIITKPPLCMQEGSLKHSLYWIKWKIENGEEKPYYQEVRRRRKRAKIMQIAKDESKSKFRYYRYKDKK